MCRDNALHAGNWRLYHLLDVAPPTTARQVKWNFRKVTLRHHYYQAYLVLCNRSRKYLYDAVGEDAYGFIESGTWGPFIPVLGAVGSVILYSLVLLIEIALLIIFFALLSADDGSYLTLSLDTVLLPLMVFASIMVAVTAMAVVVNIFSPRTYREGMSRVDRLSPVGNFLASVCYFCIPFVVVSQIGDNRELGVGHYLQYMSMPIVGDVLYYTTSIIWRWPRRLRMRMEVGNRRPSPFLYNSIFAMAFLHMFCGVAQWVLIGLKLDRRLDRSWFVIFTPFCIRAGLRICEACLRSLTKHTIGVRTAIGVAFDTVGSFFSNGMLVVSLYFVAVRIERGRQVVRLVLALIPVFLTLGWIFLGLIVTMFVLLFLYSRSSRAERLSNSRWTPLPDHNDARILGGTGTSDSVPAPFLKSSQRGWDDVDDVTTPVPTFSSTVDDAEDYEDLTAEEVEPVFPEIAQRRSQIPYGRFQNEDETSYSETAPTSRRRSSRRYEGAQHVHDRSVSGSRSVSARGDHGSARLRASRRLHDPLESITESGVSDRDYTDATTYLNNSSSASFTEDVTRSSSYTYTDGGTYSDEEGAYTHEDEEGFYTRSGSFSSSGSSSSSLASTSIRETEGRS